MIFEHRNQNSEFAFFPHEDLRDRDRLVVLEDEDDLKGQNALEVSQFSYMCAVHNKK